MATEKNKMYILQYTTDAAIELQICLVQRASVVQLYLSLSRPPLPSLAPAHTHECLCVVKNNSLWILCFVT